MYARAQASHCDHGALTEGFNGPRLFPAMFADYEPPPSTSFTMYAAPNPDEQSSSGTTLSNRMILTGETDTMSYLGNNWLSPAAAPKSSDQDRVLARGYSGE